MHILQFFNLVYVPKSSLHRVVHTKSVPESEEISYMSSRSSKSSFRKFAKRGTSVLLAVKQFVQKSSLHWVLYTKNVKESVEISYISLQSSFIHNPTSGTRQDQNRYGLVRRNVQRGPRIFCRGNVERPVLSQNGKHIVPTPEPGTGARRWLKMFLAEGWQAFGCNCSVKIYLRSIYISPLKT